MQKDQIISQLELLGLTQKEALVYYALLLLKKGTALSIAKASGLKRPTVYLVLESLVKKKLVRATSYRGVRDYHALSTEHLKRLIQSQEQLVQKHTPQMTTLYDQRADKLRLRVYSTARSIKVLLEKCLREQSQAYFLGDEHQLSNVLGPYWHYYHKRSHQLGTPPQWKMLDSHIVLLLWSDKVAFMQLGDTTQLFAFKNKQLHDVYQALWNNY